MKKLFVMFFIGLFLKGIHAEQTMPCCAPPFISNVVKPNILIIWDISGSMRWRAAMYLDNGNYNPNRIYYGYFHPDSIYQYGNDNKWYAVGYNSDHSLNTTNFNFNANRYLGNILNWGVMSRNDVAKKALTGGYGLPSNQVDKNTLIGQGDGDGWPTPWFYVGRYKYRFEKPGYMSNQPHIFYVVRDDFTTKTYNCWIDVSKVPVKYKIGVIRQIADKDLDGNWDPEAPRFGLIVFPQSKDSRYPKMLYELYQSDDDPDMEPLINAINNATPGGGTPGGNAVYEGVRYYSYLVASKWGTYQWNSNQIGKYKDPWFSGIASNPQNLFCRKSFVIVIGDGETNMDDNGQIDFSGLPQGPFSGRSLCNYFTSSERRSTYDCAWGYGSDDTPTDALDDIAYYAHITDLRPDNLPYPKGLPCPQNLTFYTIFCFGGGEGLRLFKETAIFGGFEDKDGNLFPTGYTGNPDILNDPLGEYDANHDNIPDNFYEAQTGGEIEKALREIIMRIIAGATSASQASVVAQTSKGEGIGTFALFYPRKSVGGKFLSWLGEIKGVWVDRFGFLREETVYDLNLNLKDDYVITFESPDTIDRCNPQQVVYVYRYRDTSSACNGQNLEFVDRISLEEIHPLWDGGKMLWNTNPGERQILAGIDLNYDKKIGHNEWLPFTLSNRNQFLPYFDVYSANFADTLINYIRGIDFPNLRDRTIQTKVWKLGDIIYSSPMFVSQPMERYDLLYLDPDYKDFYEEYRERRGVVYVGANDGMVHAFNVGKYIAHSETGCDAGHVDPMGIPIGKEIWAYIPFNLLPHLKWLTNPDYCHVYYVDLKPYPTDVKIFTPDQKHVGGFGTVLIGSARLGGTPYEVYRDTLSSSYFCLDITKPEEPELLWETKLPDHSYTTPYPNVVKVRNKWFLVVGTGPVLCSGFSNKRAKVYILNLNNGDIVKEFTVPETNSAIGDIISVDLGLDYSVDLIYFGTYYYTGSQSNPNWQGRVYRIKTHGDENPANWDLTLLIDLGKPVTAPGAATMDEYGNLWVYFGSGRLFYDGDELDREEQVFVGIKDDSVSTYTYADLFDVTDVHVYGDTVKIGGSKISWEELVGTIQNKDGWYRRFNNPLGERCLSRPLIIGGAVIFTTYNPEGGSICEFGGRGKLYALYYLTGTAYKKPILGEVGGESVPFVEIGGGVPSEPSMWIGASEEKAFVQIGGKIKDVSPALPLNPRGGLILWKGR